MKHLKIFNSFHKPEVGDYVICDIPTGTNNEHSDLSEFMRNNIGVILSKVRKDFDFTIFYIDLPDNLNKYIDKSKGKFRILKF